MFQMNNVNIEKLFKNVELTKIRHKTSQNEVLLFWETAYQVICRNCTLNQMISTEIEIALAKENDLSSVGTKQHY